MACYLGCRTCKIWRAILEFRSENDKTLKTLIFFWSTSDLSFLHSYTRCTHRWLLTTDKHDMQMWERPTTNLLQASGHHNKFKPFSDFLILNVWHICNATHGSQFTVCTQNFACERWWCKKMRWLTKHTEGDFLLHDVWIWWQWWEKYICFLMLVWIRIVDPMWN